MRTRPAMLFAMLLCACGGGSIGSTTNDQTTSNTPNAASPLASPAAGQHHRCGWIEAGSSAGEQSFIANAAWFDEIHPFWWSLSADGTQINPARQGTDSPGVLAAARANHVRVMPLVFFDDVNGLRAMLSDPSLRAQHAQDLVKLVQDHGYDGVELDYEQLFQAADRPGYSALMQDVAQKLHAIGKQLSVAVPGITMDGEANDAYDYVLLGNTVDRVHIMGYDFHAVSSDHSGPLAPIGWLQAIFQNVQRSGRPEVFSLGVANYSVSPGKFYDGADAQRLCGGAGAYSSQTDHMQSCPIGHYDAGLSPHCVIGGVDTYFEDDASIREKLQLARSAGIGGVAYYALGGEEPGWLDMLKQSY